MPPTPTPPYPRSVLRCGCGASSHWPGGLRPPGGISVRPLQPLQRKDLATDVARLRPLCQARGVTALVVGLPLLANGEEGSQCRQSRRYGLALARALALPLAWVDERYTSWAAGETTGPAGGWQWPPGQRRGGLDLAPMAGGRTGAHTPRPVV